MITVAGAGVFGQKYHIRRQTPLSPLKAKTEPEEPYADVREP